MKSDADEEVQPKQLATASHEVMISHQSDTQISVSTDENSLSLAGISIERNKLDNSTITHACEELHIKNFKHGFEQPSMSEATLSMRDMENSGDIPQSSHVVTSFGVKSSKKIKFSQVFHLQDVFSTEKYNSLIMEGKHDDAFEIMNKRLAVGSLKVNCSEELVRFHECLLRTKRPEKANMTRLQLLALIRKNIETTPQEIKNFADALREKSKNFDSILFDYLSACLNKDTTEPNLAVCQIANCAYRMHQSIKAMLKADESLKSMVKHHVIPLITELKTMILTIDGASEQDRCHSLNYCDHCKGRCELLVGDYEASEQTLLDAIKSMQNFFSENAKEYQLFGHLLNNLGRIYSLTSRYREASKYYEHSINAKKLAADYSSSAAKILYIMLSESNLKIVKRLLREENAKQTNLTMCIFYCVLCKYFIGKSFWH